MGARYMCGTLDIGDTRFNDVPFVPSQDCANWESCQEEAYRQGREDQGELNADTIQEIHDLVYAEAFNRAIDKCVEIAKDETCIKECKSGFNCVECMVKRMEKLKEQNKCIE